MSDQLTTETPATNAALSEISAEVSWTVGNRPPEVVLSFQGLHEPTQLWDALRAIGWDVPAMPPRPANAIEWTPDPVAGTDFTVLPWEVKEFRLEEGAWTVDESLVGDRTLDALLDNEAEIIGSSDQIAAHANTYAANKEARLLAAQNPVQVPVPAPAPVAAPPVTIDEPAAQPQHAVDPDERLPVQPVPAQAETAAPVEGGYRTIILLGFPVDSDPLPGAGTWAGTTGGREKLQTQWNEFSLGADQAIPGHQEMAAHVASGASAWYADTDQPLAETAPSGQRIVRLVLPDMSEDDAKVRRLNKVLGDSIVTHQLRSLVGSNSSAVLVSATVGANAFEMLRSNLALRMPNAIVRVNA